MTARTYKRKAPAMPAPLENSVHVQIADVLRFAIMPGWVWFHVPNGEYREKATGGRLKRMGVRPGVSDFLLVSPYQGQLHALELKREGKSPRGDQNEFLQDVVACGGRSAWVDCFDDAMQVLHDWGAVRIKL